MIKWTPVIIVAVVVALVTWFVTWSIDMRQRYQHYVHDMHRELTFGLVTACAYDAEFQKKLAESQTRRELLISQVESELTRLFPNYIRIDQKYIEEFFLDPQDVKLSSECDSMLKSRVSRR